MNLASESSFIDIIEAADALCLKKEVLFLVVWMIQYNK